MKKKISAAVLAAMLGTTMLFAGCGSNTTTENSVVLTSSEEAALMSGIHHAELEFEEGGIVYIELNADVAPITVTNFVNLCNEGFYDGLTMHRAVKNYVLQGGDPLGTGAGGSDKSIIGEFKNNGYTNDLKHTRGAVSMARKQDYNSATSQFFIVQKDQKSMNGDYACFGYVTEGMEIIDDYIDNCETIDSNGTIATDDRPVIKTIRIVD